MNSHIHWNIFLFPFFLRFQKYSKIIKVKLVLINCLRIGVLYRIGPPQNRFKNDLFLCFRVRGIHLRWSEMLEMSSFGDMYMGKCGQNQF